MTWKRQKRVLERKTLEKRRFEMKLVVQGKNFQVTDDVLKYAEKRLSTVEKFFDNIQELNTIISKERGNIKVEVTLSASGTVIRGESRTPDVFSSIDDVVDKLKRQIKKYKERFIERRRVAAKEEKKFERSTEEIEEEEPRIVKVKRFILKPMDEEEAIMQMELLGHNFFVFLNSRTDKFNVIYKRTDGNYGLIEPEE